MQIKDIVKYLDERFPKDTACDFDKAIGFAIGSINNKVNKVLLALDLTMEVAKEAVEIGANFIITHHPFFFNPVQKIIFDEPQGQIVKFMCEHNLSYYSMHTNLDCAVGGVNDVLANMLGIKYEHTEAIKNDLMRFGEVDECSLLEFVNKVKNIFKLNTVRVVGDINKKIRKVAILGGAGAFPYEMETSIRNDVDVYITGEVHLDKAIFAMQRGLALIEVNHGVERFVFDDLIKELKENLGDIFVISKYNTDPLIGY